MDGYIGWSLALRLSRLGHEVHGVDNFSRRKNVEEVGSWSATPLLPMGERLTAARAVHGLNIGFSQCDMRNYAEVSHVLERFKPNAIVHFAEQPSAPFSMIDREHAVYTQENNMTGTLNLLYGMKEYCRDAHLIKLGTLGEYGTPNIDIPEGFFEIEYRGRRDVLPFPRQAGSFYHWSKVFDSGNITFACKIWGLRSTDVMQGVVYGTRTDDVTDDRLLTRFDFDEAFGTAINRFVAQSVIGYPLSIYGKGGQRRGFIALVDSIQCLTLALNNPPESGQYRVFNQLDDVYNIYDLADAVKSVQAEFGLDSEIDRIDNPRVELEEHHYKVDNANLRNLGFRPTRTLKEELRVMFRDLLRFKDRIKAKQDVIAPRITWRSGFRSNQGQAEGAK